MSGKGTSQVAQFPLSAGMPRAQVRRPRGGGLPRLPSGI